MRSSFRTSSAISGTAAAVTPGLLVPAAASAAQLHTASAPTLTSTKATRAEKATQLSMTFLNNTSLTLTLVNAGHGGSGTHWENQPPQTLAPGATGTAPAYSSTDTEITLLPKCERRELQHLHAEG
jgi:hypothetical protein